MNYLHRISKGIRIRCMFSSLFFNKVKIVALFSFCFLSVRLMAQEPKTEEDVKKTANKLFEDEDYTQAYKYYAQLVSNYPKDPEYNYRLGVCMLFSEPDKKKCYSYLNLAANHPKDAPKDAKFYLGKAYHINYQFDEAIKWYNEYKKTASSAQIKKLQVDREIMACKNGKRLLSSLSELVVINKKQLSEADYFRSYDLSSVGGKLLVKPDEFRTTLDKKKKEKSVMYLPKSGNLVFYSSYGETGETGRDIYLAKRTADGKFGKGQRVVGINTDFDEDYPFLHPDGKTLYFSSKGFNSMGGYDIFKSTYNEETDSWSIPVNLEFPVNSPDDDYLFVTDTSQKIAFFSTGRQSPPGKIDVLKINTERRPMDIAILKGSVIKENSAQGVNSKITVKNMDNGQVVGVFNAQEGGDYKMDLPNGGKFIFTVETPGVPTQSDKVVMPLAYSLKPFKQSITYEKKVLKIINYFDTPADDDNYLQYLDLIEKKAKLDVNENDVKNSPLNNLIAQNNNESGKNNGSVNTNNPTVTNNNQSGNTNNQNNASENNPDKNTNQNKNLTKDQLLTIAKKDAQETKQEALKTKQEADNAFEIAKSQKIEADNKQKEADEALKNAKAISDPTEQQNAFDKAVEIKKQAEESSNSATAILNYAKSLEEDAANKQKIADLNQQYVNELEKVSKNPNNKVALSNLESLQKQIEENSNKKSKSEEQYNLIAAIQEQKQNEVAIAEEKSKQINKEIELIKADIQNNEDELSKTKNKKIKENLKAQIDDLKLDLDVKNKQLAQNEKNIDKLKQEAAVAQNQYNIVNKLKTTEPSSTIASNNNSNNTSGTSKTNTASASSNNEANNTLNYENVSKNYNEKLNTIENPNDKNGLQQSNNILNDYNKQLNDLIAFSKIDLKSATKPEEKTKINNEIKQLEQQVAINNKKIAENNDKIKQIDLGQTVASNNNNQSQNTSNNSKSGNETETKINNETGNNESGKTNSITNASGSGNDVKVMSLGSDASFDAEKLNALKENINLTDNTSFAFNDYKEQSSLKLKSDAEAKLSLVNAAKNELNNLIAKAEGDLKNNKSENSSNSSAGLIKEADALKQLSKEKRTEAQTKEGDEKSKLFNEAVDLVKQSNQKYLEAAEINKVNNQNEYDVNNQNINDLINAKKSSKADVEEAKKLNDEAQQAFKQAKSIREEANAQSSAAAKLGTISNAEDKEQEALAKQKKAVDLLMKSNKNFNLKSSFAESGSATDKALVDNIKQQYNKLNNEKISANMALSKANQNEIKLLSDKLAKNPAIKNNTNKEAVDYKKQADNLNKEALALIGKSLSEPDAALKQNLLQEANKKEIEVIMLLNKANDALQSPAVVSNANNQTNENNTSNEQGNNTGNEGNLNNESKTGQTANNENTNFNEGNNNENNIAAKTNTTSETEGDNNTEKTTSTKTNTNTGTDNQGNNANVGNDVSAKTNTSSETGGDNENSGKPATVKTNTGSAASENPTNNEGSEGNTSVTANTKNTNSNYKNLTDTAFKNALEFFDKDIVLKNQEANSLKNTSLNALKNLADEQLKTEAEIFSSAAANKKSESEVKNTISQIYAEADSYSKQASELRKEAADKTGEEKDKLIAEAKTYDSKSLNNKLQAAELQKNINDAQYDVNSEAINDMLTKAKAKNASEVTQVMDMLELINNLKKQANDMRNEANAYPTAAAKLGGYSNAEEKETEVWMKQIQVISMLKKYNPDYVLKEPAITSSGSTADAPPELKEKYNNITQKQISELENISKAFEMEYESSSAKLPSNLSAQQKSNKSVADNFISQSKSLVAKANQTNDINRKKELMLQSAKAGQNAVLSLGKISSNQTVAANNNTGGGNNVAANNRNNANTANNRNNQNNQTGNANTSGNNNVAANTNRNNANNAANTNRNNTNANNTAGTTNRNTSVVKVDGLEVKNTNAYSAGNPIPIDQKIPDGLVFRVQIGAFKTTIPNNYFKGLSPVNGQTADNGYIRYTAGNFDKFENANAVKNDLRNLGYKDAFVVVYYNGKKITVAEAIDILEKEGKSIDLATNTSAGIKETSNIPKNPVVETNTPENPAEVVVVTKELEKINGLLYTIQIGVYSKKINRSLLYNLQPIYTEKLPSGLYRYTAGIYNQSSRLLDDRTRVVGMGIKDAFISAYYNGKRVPYSEGQKLQKENDNIVLEPENPIVFPDGAVVIEPNTNTTPSNVPPVAPFTNGVSSQPEATPENGIKEDEAGISFKVQIGAFRNQVPNEVAAKYLNIKTWPIANKIVNGLYLYTIGNFVDAKSAKSLKDEAVSVGISDAFITVYKDGKKLYGPEAAEYLNK